MEQPALARRLGTADAVVIGLGSMIGAGVFSAFGPAARAVGAGLLIGLVRSRTATPPPLQPALQRRASGGGWPRGLHRGHPIGASDQRQALAAAQKLADAE
jgi:hypothetical protein